jgi:FAD/FMN-containing dehydrogenase
MPDGRRGYAGRHVLSDPMVNNLERVFGGDLIAPEDPRYEQARRVWNGMVDRRPMRIARCAGERDVIEALAFAREAGIRVAVRGGGHNVAGNAVCDDGLVIDLSGMKAIEVDPVNRIGRAQPGVVLGEFDRATQEFGLAAPTGNVSKPGLRG